MRLVRSKRSPEGNSLLVGEVPPPDWGLAPAMDDSQQFAAIYRRLHAPLLDHAERFLSKEDARDAVGEAVVALWLGWPSLSQEKRTDAYVFGVLHHAISATLTANSRLVSLEDAERERGEFATRAEPGEIRDDPRAEVLDAALAAMPPRRREVLLLVREQNFSYKDAAKALGVTEGTINTHIRLAMQELRAAFKRAGFRIADPKPRRLSSPKGGDNND